MTVKPQLSDLLTKHMDKLDVGDARLASQINERFGQLFIHRSSIRNWKLGTSKTVRDWRKLVAIASTLHLSIIETNQLLIASNHPQVNVLQKEASPNDQHFFKQWAGKFELRQHDGYSSELEESRNNNLLGQEALFPKLTSLPPDSRFFLSSNPNFVGRDQALLSIAESFRLNKSGFGPKKVAITGLGGIGKSQLAIEFAYRYGKYFTGGVFWLNFSESDSITTQIADCGTVRGLGLFSHDEDIPIERQVEMVLRVWQESTPRLLIFDNCEEESLLKEWSPSSGGCHILITSRRAIWDPSLNVEPIPLNSLDRRSSIKLLKSLAPDSDKEELGFLAEELGDHPLALHLVGCFLNKYKNALSPRDYFQQLQSNRESILDDLSLKGSGTKYSPTDHELNVARTFAISFNKLDSKLETDKLAELVLAHISCLAPNEPISRELLSVILGIQNKNIASTLLFEDALIRLQELGLVRFSNEGFLQIHQLLAVFVKNMMNDELFEQTVVSNLVTQIREVNVQQNPALFQYSKAHLYHAFRYLSKRPNQQAAEMCSEIGNYFQLAGNYLVAETALNLAYTIQKNIADDKVAITAGRLAIVYGAKGNYYKALYFHKKALDIRKKVFGYFHLETAWSYNNLGVNLLSVGEIILWSFEHDWQPDFTENIKNKVKAYTDSKLQINSLSDLANACLEKAWIFLDEARQIKESILDSNHLSTAFTLGTLGILFLRKKEFDKAEKYINIALTIREASLEFNHPLIANCYRRLGELATAQGFYSKSETFFTHAQELYTSSLGEGHPDVAWTLSHLGWTYFLNGNIDQALTCYEQALAISERSGAYNNIYRGLLFYRLALGFRKKGHSKKAEEFLTQARTVTKFILDDQELFNFILDLSKISVLGS